MLQVNYSLLNIVLATQHTATEILETTDKDMKWCGSGKLSSLEQFVIKSRTKDKFIYYLRYNIKDTRLSLVFLY